LIKSHVFEIENGMKNNVTRYLDQREIDYQVFELPVAKLSAQETADILEQPLDLIFKTIVVKRERRGKPILAVVPGTGEVDLKALAKAVGEKKVSLASHEEAEKRTRLQVGGISPLALLNRGFQVVIDESALSFDYIHVSGGERGMSIRLAGSDLVELTNAGTAMIVR
jgi:Cys-tRNA(Pro)/Cys-tRNA(Cys) deacylase